MADELTNNEVRNRRLKAYLAAEEKTLTAQKFDDGTVSLQRASLRNIRDGIDGIVEGMDDGSDKLAPSSMRKVVLTDY